MRSFLIAASLLVLAAGPGAGQTAGNVATGRALADDICADCHAVEAGEFASPDAAAPPFQAIADRPEMSEMALTVFFRTPHPSMPNLVVTGDDARNLIAYIRSLKR